MPDNLENIVNYIRSGIKKDGEPGRLGVELEHFICDERAYAVPYAGAAGVNWVLEQLAPQYDEVVRGDDGEILGLTRENAAITLEPAAQLELSAGPYEELGLIRYDFEEFHRELAKLLGQHKQRVILLGYQPAAKANDLTLIPKQRYDFMDAHFQNIGPYGRFMMRGSAATQISIDFYSEEDCLRKLKAASALSPLFALLCDNSPVFEGEPSPHHLMRTEIWRECDPARCGLIPGVLRDDFTLEDYARYALDTPAIYARNEQGERYATEEPLGVVFKDMDINDEDIEHALSMLFNDVRLKRYIEIRTADAMPAPFVVAYAALIKGLFYNEESLAAVEQMVKGVTEDDVLKAKADLMECGYDAIVYGKPAGEIIDELFDLAYEALARNEKSYLIPLKQMAKTRTTLAMQGHK